MSAGKDLGGAARSLLDAAAGAGPDAAAIARMRTRIDAAVATPAVGGALASKLGLIGLVAIVIVGTAGLARLATRSDDATAVASFEVVDPPAHPRHTSRESNEPMRGTAGDSSLVRSDVGRTTSGIGDPRPRTKSASEANPTTPPTPVTPVAASRHAATSTVDLAREVELVDRATAALRRGDAAAAITAVRLHATETADRGQLAEDAAAIEIEALCTLHDPSTRRRLTAFDARWPASAQRSRLRCR